MDQISIIQPDDWHLHLRDNKALATTVPASTRGLGRGIVMPNLSPPVTTGVAAAKAYRERILSYLPEGVTWEPLMVLYLTDNSPAEEIRSLPLNVVLSTVVNIIPLVLRQTQTQALLI